MIKYSLVSFLGESLERGGLTPLQRCSWLILQTQSIMWHRTKELMTKNKTLHPRDIINMCQEIEEEEDIEDCRDEYKNKNEE